MIATQDLASHGLGLAKESLGLGELLTGALQRAECIDGVGGVQMGTQPAAIDGDGRVIEHLRAPEVAEVVGAHRKVEQALADELVLASEPSPAESELPPDDVPRLGESPSGIVRLELDLEAIGFGELFLAQWRKIAGRLTAPPPGWGTIRGVCHGDRIYAMPEPGLHPWTGRRRPPAETLAPIPRRRPLLVVFPDRCDFQGEFSVTQVAASSGDRCDPRVRSPSRGAAAMTSPGPTPIPVEPVAPPVGLGESTWARARAVMRDRLRQLLYRADEATVEDAAQEALVRLLRVVRHEGVRNLDALMNDICRKTAIDHLRWSRRFGESFEPMMDHHQDKAFESPVDPLSRLEFVVLEFFQARQTPCYELAVAFFDDRSWEQVAEVTGKSYASVRKQWSRCVALLRELARRAPECFSS